MKLHCHTYIKDAVIYNRMLWLKVLSMLTCADDPCADNATCLPSSDGRSYTCDCAQSPPDVVLGPDCYPLPQTPSTASTSSYSSFLLLKLKV